MKAKITLAMAVFIGLVFCSTAIAYIPAMIIRECPHCRAHVVEETMVSGNTIGAKFYTDGKREARMLPDHPALVRCPVCSGFFWVDEAGQIDSGFDAAAGKQQVSAPSEKEMLTFLEGPALSKEKEIYLRMHAWWLANDAWRWVPDSKPAFSGAQLKNLKALSEMLDETEPNQRILKAEIAREMGEFEKCLHLLSHPFDKGYDHAADFIRKLAEEKTRAVRQFLPGK